MNNLLTNQMPAVPDAEQSVLGAMMIDNQMALTALSMLGNEDFYSSSHRTIFRVISHLINQGNLADLVTVENTLSARGELEGIGGNDVLLNISRATGMNVEYNCQILIQKKIARQLIEKMSSIVQRAYQPSEDPDGLLNEAESVLHEIMTKDMSGNTYDMKQVMTDTLEELLSIQDSDNGIIGLSSGLPYDKTTSGYQSGKVYVIAARPGMGKTAFMLHNIQNIARDGYRCGVISLEMGYKSLGARLLLAQAGVDSQKARTGRLNPGEIDALYKAASQLQNAGIWIDDTTQLDPSLLRVKARMMKQIHGIDLLAIDYLQLMTSGKKARYESREQEVSDFSRTCKMISKDLDIPVLSLAQLSREPDKRNGWGTRPQLSDLRESGSIEQDADLVMFLYRPAEYGLHVYPDDQHDAGMKTEGITEVLICKHRDGPTGGTKLKFDPSKMKYYPLSRLEEFNTNNGARSVTALDDSSPI